MPAVADLIVASAAVKGGKLFIRNRRAFNQQVAQLKDGWEMELTLSRRRATRSPQANRFYWGVVIHLLSEHTGYTPDDLHDVLKQMFLPKGIDADVNHDGFLRVRRADSAMGGGEFGRVDSRSGASGAILVMVKIFDAWKDGSGWYHVRLPDASGGYRWEFTTCRREVGEQALRAFAQQIPVELISKDGKHLDEVRT